MVFTLSFLIGAAAFGVAYRLGRAEGIEIGRARTETAFRVALGLASVDEDGARRIDLWEVYRALDSAFPEDGVATKMKRYFERRLVDLGR
jgi:hypothetical protein